MVVQLSTTVIARHQQTFWAHPLLPRVYQSGETKMQWASHNHNSVGHDSVDDEKAVGKYDYYNKTLGKIEKNTKPDLTKS